MNFLGHVYLSPADDEILVGNFIADSVKGDPYKQLPEGIADGVMLHRMIDQYTDQHPQVRQGIDRLRPSQGRFAAVVIDVIYDHILAGNWSEFHHQTLNEFTSETYERLSLFENVFPDRVKQYFPYMRAQNWLFNYQFEWGLEKSLQGLDRRATAETEMHRSVSVYKENADEYRLEFGQFILDAQKAVQDHSTFNRS